MLFPLRIRHLLALGFSLSATGAASAQEESLAIFRETLFSPAFPFTEPQGPNPRLNNNGPWAADVIVYRTSLNGAAERVATFERAGVPTIARLKDGRIIVAHQHFPADDDASFDKVAVHFSADEGRAWTAAAVIKINGLAEGLRFPFDPTLVSLPDGRVRMYFTSLQGRRFEDSVPAIYSAISTDGIDYTFEPGMRFGIEGRNVIDCAAVLHQGTFHLFSPDNGARTTGGRNAPGAEPEQDHGADGVGYHAISSDGLNFTRVEDVKIEGRRRWLGNAQSDGKVITFYGTGQPRQFSDSGPRGNVWIGTSADGKAWELAAGPSVFGGDPGGLTTADNGHLIVITGEPQEGRQRRQQSPPKRRPAAPQN